MDQPTEVMDQPTAVLKFTNRQIYSAIAALIVAIVGYYYLTQSLLQPMRDRMSGFNDSINTINGTLIASSKSLGEATTSVQNNGSELSYLRSSFDELRQGIASLQRQTDKFELQIDKFEIAIASITLEQRTIADRLGRIEMALPKKDASFDREPGLYDGLFGDFDLKRWEIAVRTTDGSPSGFDIVDNNQIASGNSLDEQSVINTGILRALADCKSFEEVSLKNWMPSKCRKLLIFENRS